MTYEDFRDRLFQTALKSGCSAAETYYVEGDTFSVNILEGEMDRYVVSKTSALGLRVQVKGRNGYSYTEALEDPARLVDHAIDNANVIENDDESPMQGRCEYEQVTPPESPLNLMDEQQKIKLAKELEQAAKSEDSRVIRMGHCLTASFSTAVRIDNTLGLSAQKRINSGYCVACPILSHEGQMKNAFAFRSGKNAADIQSCAEEAVRKAAAQFGSASAAPGRYRIVLHADAAADFFEAFSPMFSADAAQKGLSPLRGKEKQRIGSELITIIDDPLHPDNPSAFDDEGTPSVAKTVVDRGVLMTLLHNLKTAKKAGVESTSNASRPGPGSPVGVAPSNFYVAPGEKDLSELLFEMDNGILITELSGLHSGVHPVSGEFSLLAKGHLVEDGKTIRPVDQITIAGKFLALLDSVRAVGSDLRFSIPGDSRFGSPSLYIEEVMVSGK
ncbi:MAG: peptidase PmbA [Firmicutes bacterium ADurb.Bin182]|nr:MAG: peptidase PmbA [Firmicutes bacterium ADurb.Bin182]